MTVIATALKHLMAAGLSGQALVDAIAEIEAAAMAVRPIDEATARRRERDREYQARRRRQSRQTSADADDPPPKDIYSNPPPEKPTPDGVVKKRAKPRSAEFEVPEWVPAEPWAAFEAMRRRKGKPLDSYIAKQLFGRLRSIRDAGWSLEDVINKATIACHDGFWMPDGRDPNVRRAAAPAAVSSPEELERRARWFADKGRDDEAARLRKEAEKIRGKPPPQIASIIHSAARSMRAQ